MMRIALGRGGRAFRRPPAWSALVVAGGWLGLWLLWPSAPPAGARPALRLQAPVAVVGAAAVERAAAHRMPTLFARPYGLAGPAPEDDRLIDLSGRVWRERARPLPRQGQVPWLAAPGPRNGAHDCPRASIPSGGYRPLFADRSVFRPPAGAGLRKLMIAPDAVLAEHGFAAGPPPGLTETNQAWEVLLRVEMDEHGMARQVFVLESSGIAAADADAVRAVAGAGLRRPGTVAGGRVRVTFGGP